MKKLAALTKFIPVLIFVVSFFTTASQSPVAAFDSGLPCLCDSAGTGTQTCFGNGCAPGIQGLPCGRNSKICNSRQMEWSCQQGEKFTSIASFTPAYSDEYLCVDDSGNGKPGSWSEVFKRCFCSTGELIQQIVNIAVFSVSALALALLGIGAIKYITAQNNPDKIQSAKELMLSAVAGLAIVLVSVAILQLIKIQFPEEWGINPLIVP